MKGEKRKRSIALKMRSGNLTKMKGKKKKEEHCSEHEDGLLVLHCKARIFVLTIIIEYSSFKGFYPLETK
jgi:hypothetical protein